jgi:predicted Rossmann-fold nucleotide-binding protein
MATEDFIKKDDLKLFTLVDTPEQIIPALQAHDNLIK